MRTSSGHYDDHYFAWQNPIGAFGGWANLIKFEKYIRPEFNVIDFGCGGGDLLTNLKCKGKIGLDVSEAARNTAQRLGIEVFATPESVADEWADLIISNNALEHCRHPLHELQTLWPKLKPGGRIIFVVPCESIRYKYVPKDINHHLYSWSPMCLGNLFSEAGFVVEESRPFIRKWPVGYRILARIGGRPLFDITCWIYGHLARSWFQVRVVARKH